jgi:hypothetical protein
MRQLLGPCTSDTPLTRLRKGWWSPLSRSASANLAPAELHSSGAKAEHLQPVFLQPGFLQPRSTLDCANYMVRAGLQTVSHAPSGDGFGYVKLGSVRSVAARNRTTIVAQISFRLRSSGGKWNKISIQRGPCFGRTCVSYPGISQGSINQYSTSHDSIRQDSTEASSS